MRSVLSILALSAVCGPAAAAPGQVGVAFGGGWLAMDRAETLDSTWTANARLGWSATRRVWFEAQTGYSRGVTRTDAQHLFDVWTPRLELTVDLAPDAPVVPLLSFGGGVIHKTVLRDPDVAGTAPVEEGWGNYKNPDLDALVVAGPGLKIPLASVFNLRLDGRWLLNLGAEPHGVKEDVFSDWEATAWLQLDLGHGRTGPDRERDGVSEALDLCPTEPEDFDHHLDHDGCPDPDNDGDGVSDWNDDCPDAAEDIDGQGDDDGCPDPDHDGDGVPDGADACLDEAEDHDTYRDADGCPDLDNDGDGIADDRDACPLHAEDLDGFRDADGCPEEDNDGDGVVDLADLCVFDAEVRNGYADDDGCPDVLPEALAPFVGVVENIRFDTDSDRLRPDSATVLAEAAAVLNRFPEVTVEVQGHTDDEGDDAHNLALSQRRAEAVVAWLVGAGVPAERLTARGYGETSPRADNATEQGRQLNRRVEFLLRRVPPQ